MTKTLTKTKKETTRRTIEIDYALHLYPKANIVLARVVTKVTDVKKGKPVTTWYLFSQATYDKYQHRKSWIWIVNLSRDDLFAVMTVEYMNHYLGGSGYQYPDDKPKHVSESGWERVLDAGDYSRVTCDKTWYDGMMYDPQDQPIRRAFHFDYISGGLGSDYYDLSKLEEWLKRQKSVRNVERISVPYYNSDSCGSQAIEFTFQPSHRMFLRMCEKGALTDFQIGEFIREHLKVAKFQIPEKVQY